MRRILRFVRFAPVVGLSLILGCFLGSAGRLDAQVVRSTIDNLVSPEEYQEELDTIHESLLAHKWKRGLRHARSLTETILRRSWHGKELQRMLSELALYQAVAEANLPRLRYEAIWHWHIAQNLDFKMRNRDLSPYGRAGALLREFPLRRQGSVPAGFEVATTYPTGPRLDPPRKPGTATVPTVLNNTGAALEGSGDFKVEVIVDKYGRLHQPVVISTYLHPIVIYGSLEWLRDWAPFQPARLDGKPADYLDTFTVQFQILRW